MVINSIKLSLIFSFLALFSDVTFADRWRFDVFTGCIEAGSGESERCRNMCGSVYNSVGGYSVQTNRKLCPFPSRPISCRCDTKDPMVKLFDVPEMHGFVDLGEKIAIYFNKNHRAVLINTDENGGIVNSLMLGTQYYRDGVAKALYAGEHGLIVYTTTKFIYLNHDIKTDWTKGEQLGKDWNLRDLARINDDLFLLTEGGNLWVKNLTTKKLTKLVDGALANVKQLISVGNRLVWLHNTGKMFSSRFDGSVLAEPNNIGSGWGEKTVIAQLNDDAFVIKSPSNKVFVKNADDGAVTPAIAFKQGLVTDNTTFFELKDMSLVGIRTPAIE